jgi:hypothetical protein
LNPDTFAAFLSVIAAGGSAVAAGMSYKLAKAVEKRALDDERRRLERDIDEMARVNEVDARRAAAVSDRIKLLQNDWFNAAGAFHGSPRANEVQRTEQTVARLSDIRQQTKGIANMVPGNLDAVDLAARLPPLQTQLAQVRSILDDALRERDELTARIVSYSTARRP